MNSGATVEDKVRLLLENLAALWNDGEEVIARLCEAAPETDSPMVAFLKLQAAGALDHLFTGDNGRALDEAMSRLDMYLTDETWFDRKTKADQRLSSLRQAPVAYFCAEFGFADWLPIYSGGLGILAGDVVKEASDLGLPVVAIGLFYRHGFFNQRLDETGYQREEYPSLDPERLPLTLVSDDQGRPVVVAVPIAEGLVYARIWRLQVGRVSLHLLDTDVPENESAADRAITANLYGGDSRTRIKQELVLGIGGVRALRALGIRPSVYSMNEGHAAFLGLELVIESLSAGGFAQSLNRARGQVVYTNHTVVPAGNDVFSQELVLEHLGPYASSRGIDTNQFLELGGEASFSMALLAFRLSAKANAVSHIHAKAIRNEPAWAAFPVEAVTNGVHIPSWLGPEIRALLDAYVPSWRGDDPDWDQIDSIPGNRLWDARQRQRARLLRSVREHASSQEFDHSALTIVWARRFAQYKRAGLLAHDIDRLAAIMGDSERPVQVIIAGKAHPRDEGGKRMLQDLVIRLRSDSRIAPGFAFIPDYRISVASLLVQGADIWLNTPRKPLEASGTSGMKSSDNGGLQLTVKDGWADEVDWEDLGWVLTGFDDHTDADQIYRHLESSIVPAYYSRDESGVPADWLARVRKTMKMSLARYSASRMVREYMTKLYLPLLLEQEPDPVRG